MVKNTIPLGRVAGVEISAHWSALVTVGLFTWVLGAYLSGTGSTATVWITAVAGALALVACLLAHELAHSIVARRNGIRVQGIVLWLLGGVSELTEEPRDARADLRIALAGPATSLGMAAVAGGGAALAALISPDGTVTAVLVWLAMVNTVLALFNMLPGAPLDGGRVLRAILWRRSGDRLRAATAAARSGQILGLVLLFTGLGEVFLFGQAGGLWLMLLGWFLRTAAHTELTASGLRHRLGDTRIHDIMTPDPMALRGSWKVTDLLGSAATHTKHRVFPVIDDAGRPFAVLAWSDVVAVPEKIRATADLAELARRLPPTAIVGADEPLAEVATRVLLRPNLDAVAVVDPVGRLAGLVTATDLTLACDRSALGLPIDHTTAPEPLRPGSRWLTDTAPSTHPSGL
ncbi:site-2 protease family protein [Nocardia huaxiensis]|uniref:site-2 protease family protein n=1 Tax=Nocardia huaxiensis TaxID=2755382 RepID=UPI001E613E1B|nr:site-2 protease family protein [Nocardia huaxiensis]UFS97928.1 site-2 protease family protein [Nocardia huaxiensis]